MSFSEKMPRITLTRLRCMISWAASLQLALGFMLAFSAFFLVSPSAATHHYPIFFAAVLIPAGALLLGSDLLDRRPLKGSLILGAAAAFDCICFFDVPATFNIGVLLIICMEGIGIISLGLLLLWTLKGRPRR